MAAEKRQSSHGDNEETIRAPIERIPATEANAAEKERVEQDYKQHMQERLQKMGVKLGSSN